MRIALNGMFLIPGQVGGSETYLRSLVRALASLETGDEYVLIVGRETAPTFRLASPAWRVCPSPVVSRRRVARLILEQTWLPIIAQRAHCDVIHSAGYTAPLLRLTPGVVSVLDMNYRRHPEDFTALERQVYAALIPPAARLSDHVLTLSEAAKRDVLTWTGVPPHKVTPVPLAPRADWPGNPEDDAARLHALGVRQPFILSVAASHPHKNLGRLIQALPVTTPDGSLAPLVMVGTRGRAKKQLEEIAQERWRHVRVLGWIDSDALGALYRNALALAFPSLYEGFGLPILEAMALGTPVVTSNYGAMAEVAGDAAEFVDPYDVASIRAGLNHVISDMAWSARLRERGLERARQFTWSGTASLTHAVYARIATGQHRSGLNQGST
jgi:glycosyltransferase involved in cell wall biosynthesis